MNGHAVVPPYRALAVPYRMPVVARPWRVCMVAQTLAFAHHRELYRPKVHWWASSPPQCACVWPLPSIILTGMSRIIAARSQCCSCRRAHGEWLVIIELNSLKTAAVPVADTRMATARSTTANGQARTGEQELCIICSIMSAAHASAAPGLRAEGTYKI